VVARSWRKLHNDKLHRLYSSPKIVGVIKSRRMSWAGHGMHGGGEKCLQSFGWEAQREETTTGRTKCRWEDNIKTGLQETGMDGAKWI
jgi:hypothetical protein